MGGCAQALAPGALQLHPLTVPDNSDPLRGRIMKETKGIRVEHILRKSAVLTPRDMPCFRRKTL